MNNKTKRHKLSYTGSLTRSILVQFVITVIIATIVLLMIFFLAAQIASNYTWHGTELFYRIFAENRFFFLIFSWVVLALLILAYYWHKTINYINVIASASEKLVDGREGFISLPAELKWIEEKMNQIKQESLENERLARQAEQRKNDMIVYLAHDLKTPLTSVIGYLSLLHDEAEISEETRDRYLSIALSKSERLEELINEFFEITRFNLTELTLEPSRVNLTRMLQQICSEFEPVFAEKRLTWSIFSDGDIDIICDVDKMERVFDNLIRNASFYSFAGSEIRIDVNRRGNLVEIFFENSGNTIPADKLDRIFEQFYRLDSSRSSSTGGAGLGLAVSKQIIEHHGGTVSVESENEKVCFIITLPASQENLKN